MKKFYMTMVAMLFGFTAMAQTEDGLYANEIKVEKGTTSVSFDLCLKNSMDVAAVSFRLGLPDGVGMTINKKGMKYITLNDDRMFSHAYKIQDAEDGSDMISIYDNNPFFENDGALATIPLTLTEEIAAVDGTYEVKLYNISVADPAGNSLTVAGLMPTEYTFKLIIGNGDEGEPTPIGPSASISIDDVKAFPDGKTKSYVEVLLNESEPGAVITAAMFRLALPEGVSIARVYSEDDEEYVDDITWPAAKSKHQVNAMATENTNEIQYSAAGTSGVFFKTSTRVLCRIGIIVSEDVEEGEYEMKSSKINFTYYNEEGESKPMFQDDFTAKLIVARSVSINSINADDVNAPIYNVAGQRVSKTQKGIFIQNGKKIAVK